MFRISRVLPVSMVFFAIPLIASSPARRQTDLGSLVENNATFGFDLYQVLRESEGNLFLSPYSISTALAITYAGVRGRTETEMADVLHFPPGQSTFHQTLSTLQSHVNSIQETGDIRLHIANSLWYQEEHHFLETFLNLTGRSYEARLNPVDFVRRTEAVRLTINAWAA